MHAQGLISGMDQCVTRCYVDGPTAYQKRRCSQVCPFLQFPGCGLQYREMYEQGL